MTDMKERGLLLDTCAVIWFFNGEPVSDAALKAFAETTPYISPISAWEIGMLAAKNRVAFSIPARTWVDQVFTRPNVRIADMTPEVLVDSSFLPGSAPSDPADRIIISSARHFGLDIVTRDHLILEYAKHGHVGALKC
ncbi:MAG: type II toxin-antitoxin system VapC family toxin [Pseudohongiellaceae bacterium]